jgi:regulator of sigma D
MAVYGKRNEIIFIFQFFWRHVIQNYLREYTKLMALFCLLGSVVADQENDQSHLGELLLQHEAQNLVDYQSRGDYCTRL